MPQLKMLSYSTVLFSANFANFSSLLFLALLFDFSFSQPINQQKSIQELLDTPSLLPSTSDEKNDPFVDPPQQKQRWLSVRPFLQEYRGAPHTDDLGLLLHYYLDSKRSASEDERHGISGSPLGTMRFGKRTFNSPLGTMRFGKREYGESPLGTMRFG